MLFCFRRICDQSENVQLLQWGSLSFRRMFMCSVKFVGTDLLVYLTIGSKGGVVCWSAVLPNVEWLAGTTMPGVT